MQLKENHAHTRERASVMTCVSSSTAAAGQPRSISRAPLFSLLVGPLKGGGKGDHIVSTFAYLIFWFHEPGPCFHEKSTVQ